MITVFSREWNACFFTANTEIRMTNTGNNKQRKERFGAKND
jgi:hypothetical protein